MTQQLLFTNDVAAHIQAVANDIKPNSTFILADDNTARCVLPELQSASALLARSTVITIPSGDISKNLESLAHVWKMLGDNGGTRSSLLINIGGGVITDLGAFAASTFKRGIPFINVPTTLLAAVDASVGGKTGINFNGLKNEIGVFNEAPFVIISTSFFKTLPAEEIRSGYAEMIKHALLTSDAEFEALTSRPADHHTPQELLTLLQRSVEVKRHIVTTDPTEKGPRRALNLGHTAGHAFETMAMGRRRPIPHGYAVAYGLIVTLILSHTILGLSTAPLYRLAGYISNNYGAFPITCYDYPQLLELMGHDKKNERTDRINFTLLRAIGSYECGVTVPAEEITAALDIYRDLLHL